MCTCEEVVLVSSDVLLSLQKEIQRGDLAPLGNTWGLLGAKDMVSCGDVVNELTGRERDGSLGCAQASDVCCKLAARPC